MIKILKINDQDVNLTATDGGVVTINYNETLDNAVIRVPHLQSKLDIKPFYNVLLQYGENNLRYMCVDSYTCTMDSLDRTTYTYEIHLFSETKKLERTILPNLSITPRKAGDKLTVADYLKQYVDEYSPKKIVSGGGADTEKRTYSYIVTTELLDSEYIGTTMLTIPLEDGQIISNLVFTKAISPDANILSEDYQIVQNQVFLEIKTDVPGTVQGTVKVTLSKPYYDTTNHLVNTYSLQSEYTTKFNKICPESQWTNPTLREVLNTLMMYCDCIVTMENNVIKWLDLTQTKEEITTYNYIQESQSSEDYETDIRMELQNVMQTQVDGIENVVRTVERIPFTSSAYIGTSENVYLTTQYPIMNIDKLYIVIYPCKEDVTTKVEPYKYDITEFVKEEQEYQRLPVKLRIPSISDILSNIDYFKTIQNTTLHFTRLSTAIEGFQNSSKSTIIIESQHTALQYLQSFAFRNYCDSKGITLIDILSFVSGTNKYFSTSFEIEYETTQSCVFEAGKKKASGFKSVIVDNQTNAWADAYSVGRLEYQKANRLGNRVWMLNQRVTPNTDIIEIGQTLGDFIVYQVQYQQYVDHEEVNAYMVENYVFRNYFTGIQSKVRTWVNARNEAFQKHDLIKYYCEFSKTKKVEVLDVDIDGKASYFLSPLTQTGDSIKYSGITTDETENWFNVGCLTRLVGNSIVLTTGFNDNGFAGKYVDTSALKEARTDYLEEGISFDGETEGTGYYNSPPRINTLLVGETALGGVPYSNYSYVNDDFECSEIRLKFSSNMDYTTSDDAYDIYEESYQRPKIDPDLMNGDVLNFNIKRHKDNKEIPLFSVQFEICTDTNDIDFTPEFLSYQKAISTLGTQTVKLLSDGVEKTFQIADDGNSATITMSVDHGAFYVNDEEVLTFTDTNVIYLNLRRAR